MLDKRQMVLPEFSEVIFKGKRTKYCLLIPNFNEKKHFSSQIEKMRKQGIFNIIDVIVCDAGSTDGSADPEILREAGFTALLVRHGAGRYSTDIRMGFGWAWQQGYAGVIIVDCNDKDDTSAIPRFIAKLDEGYDYVQGSRFIPGGYHENTPASRYWAIKLIMVPLMSLGAHHYLTDSSNGFRAYSMRFLTDERVNPFRNIFVRHELAYYLPNIACRLKFRVIEIPVTRVYPSSGEVPTHATMEDNWKTIVVMLRLLGNGYRPKGKKCKHSCKRRKSLLTKIYNRNSDV